MRITDVQIFLAHEDKLKAYATITFEDAFIVRDLKIIQGTGGLFIAMPAKKRKDGSFKDIAHPLNAEMRGHIEEMVFQAYHVAAGHGSVPVEVSDPTGENSDI
ncbi:MAG: septation regulator SpoVG [Bdellovibrionota bacterium]